MKDELMARLAELRETVERARSMPMSSSAVLNRADVLEQIDELEAAITATLARATDVVGDREAVVAAGQTEAEEILAAAQAEQDRLVSDTDVFKLAQARADEITEAAQRDAAALRLETDEYVESRLANFELTLEKTLKAVKRGRARLNEGHSSGLADDSDVADITLPEHLRRGDR